MIIFRLLEALYIAFTKDCLTLGAPCFAEPNSNDKVPALIGMIASTTKDLVDSDEYHPAAQSKKTECIKIIPVDMLTAVARSVDIHPSGKSVIELEHEMEKDKLNYYE